MHIIDVWLNTKMYILTIKNLQKSTLGIRNDESDSYFILSSTFSIVPCTVIHFLAQLLLFETVSLLKSNEVILYFLFAIWYIPRTYVV